MGKREGEEEGKGARKRQGEWEGRNLGILKFIFTPHKAILIPISFLTVGMKMSKGDGNFWKVLKNHRLLNATAPSFNAGITDLGCALPYT